MMVAMVEAHLLCHSCGTRHIVDLRGGDSSHLAAWVASHWQPRLVGALVTVDGQHLSALRYARPVRLG